MPASIRIIKIIKDPITHEEAYTVEFECETESSKDLLTELSSSPIGKRVIGLLDKAEFIPEYKEATAEEIKLEAEKEDTEIKEREEELREEGRKETLDKLELIMEDLPPSTVKKIRRKMEKEESTPVDVDAPQNDQPTY